MTDEHKVLTLEKTMESAVRVTFPDGTSDEILMDFEGEFYDCANPSKFVFELEFEFEDEAEEFESDVSDWLRENDLSASIERV